VGNYNVKEVEKQSASA